jgi:BirA family biotin operon repressor/biotin-[acetyl-CoA-carboxylase] ligase
VGLKWPNDLLATGRYAGAKLGGILIETRAAGGGIAAIIGVGINCRTVPGLEHRLRRRLAALEELVQPLPRRELLAARLAGELVRALRAFETGGLAVFSEEWESLHAFRGERLRVSTDRGRVVSGTAEGLAADGGLRLRTRSGVRTVHNGSVVIARPA